MKNEINESNESTLSISKYKIINDKIWEMSEEEDPDTEYSIRRQKILIAVLQNIYMPIYKDNMSFYYYIII